MRRTVASIGVYLGVLSVALLGTVLLARASIWESLVVAIPIVGVSLVLLVIQRLFAFRDDWRAWRPALGVDLLHFVLSNGLVSFLVGVTLISAAFGAADAISAGLGFEFWPAQAPLALQVILAVIVADFGGYWVHRWAHGADWLWRFHAIHHSSEALYVFASGRNHPFNVFLSTLGQLLPLAILGAGQEVLALVTTFVAVHGMLQHANIGFELGPLNYVFSGPELHRVHHSVDPDAAHSNFASNLVLWDLVFQTYRHPTPAMRKHAVGLPIFRAPRNFFEQLAVPFTYRRYVVPAPALAGEEGASLNAAVASSTALEPSGPIVGSRETTPASAPRGPS